MEKIFYIDESLLSWDRAKHFLLEETSGALRHANQHRIEISENRKKAIEASCRELYSLLDKKVPIYGVNTGFGDSLFRFIPVEGSRALQNNLVSYLMCGTGRKLPRLASKATVFFRLFSLSQGLSGVSVDLVQTLISFLERDWTPVIPCQGSLGASGDLIPLAYIAGMLRGEGEIETPEGIFDAATLFKQYNVKPYSLGPKEGLAIVNGTSTMCGMAFVNLLESEAILDWVTQGTAWLVLALQGRREAFGTLVNAKAKKHPGQTAIAEKVLKILDEEDYATQQFEEIVVDPHRRTTTSLVQDRYSLRCTPQVLGPVLETIQLARQWLETEINGVSDNPLIDPSGEMATGGNFYGGYLGQGMDYLKISLGHIADLVDRQTLYIIDDKSNRGLPANLADWTHIPEDQRFLHHGLKGLHQSVSAITSELLAKTMPNGMFSRSSESHNQDKVSLGMSSAMQTQEVLDILFNITSMYLIILAQALDLRGVKLQGSSLELYERIRKHVPFVTGDRSLGKQIEAFALDLRESSHLRKETHDGT